MGFFLTAVEYLAYVFDLFFLTVCLASGLYYVAELIEEYTVLTKKIMRYTILAILGTHLVFLLFEDFPILNIFSGLVAHGMYLMLLRDFPFIRPTDPKSLTSVLLLILNHGLWFWFFLYTYYSFGEMLAIFILCVWLVPVAFFVSLSASENTLPGLTFPGGSSGGFNTVSDGGRPAKRSVFLSFFDFLRKKRDELLPNRRFE